MGLPLAHMGEEWVERLRMTLNVHQIIGICLNLFALSLVLELRDEERVVSQYFPNDYAAYERCTKAIILFIW